MGYRRKKTMTLRWVSGEMQGLEVEVRRVSVDTLFDVAATVDKRMASKENFRAAVNELVAFIVGWNYETDDGKPVPVSAETLLAEDADFTMAIFKAWADALGGVSAPLEQPSPDGELEAGLPVEVL